VSGEVRPARAKDAAIIGSTIKSAYEPCKIAEITAFASRKAALVANERRSQRERSFAVSVQPAGDDVKEGRVVRSPLLRALVALAILVVVLVTNGHGVALAQTKAPPPASAAEVEKDKTLVGGARDSADGGTREKVDEEATDSPRASMRRFLDLAERGRYQEASIYLDVPRASEKHAADFASKLHAVLEQRLLINPETLSPIAQGRPSDGLPAGTEELGRINDAKGHPVPIRLVRHEPRSPDDEPRWVFSQSTVAAVPALYNSLRDRWIRERLPPSLLAQGPLALYHWQWLALPLLAALGIAAGRALSFFSGVVAKRALSHHPWSDRLLAGLKAPTTFGWALALFWIAMPILALTLRAEELIERGLRALGYLTFFWALLRVVSVVGDELRRSDWARARPSARSLSAMGVSLGKVIVAALALMVALSELGYPVTSIIAGLGIGGVALALAAQKTVENLFGSISILVDRPFVVGDTIRVDMIEGTVESIGLRSTRVRTTERTVVIFANGKLADMRVESLGPRDRIRFATKVQLARTATTSQVRRIVSEVTDKLAVQPLVLKSQIFVRLSSIGEASYDIEVSAPIETLDFGEFARVRENLLLAIVEIVEKAGAKLAVPTR
jgi:MscS family membrane protein